MIDLLKITIEDSFRLLIKLAPLLFLGLFVAGIMYRIPAVRKVGILMKPLCSMSKLPQCCSIYFTLCLLNPPAGTMTLVEFRKKGMIDGNVILVSYLVAGIPITIYFVLFFAGPVALPFLGISAGLLYLTCFLGCGVFQTLAGIVLGKLLLEKGPADEFECIDEKISPSPLCQRGARGDFHASSRRQAMGVNKTEVMRILGISILEALKIFKAIAKILIPIVILVFLLIHSGAMGWIGSVAKPLTSFLGLPSSSIDLISTSTVNLIAACGMGGSLLSEGVLSGVEVVISLMAGAFLYNLGELWHTILPYNISFFGLNLGAKISVSLWITIGISELFIIMILIVLRG